jgi:hypothetical protein
MEPSRVNLQSDAFTLVNAFRQSGGAPLTSAPEPLAKEEATRLIDNHVGSIDILPHIQDSPHNTLRQAAVMPTGASPFAVGGMLGNPMFAGLLSSAPMPAPSLADSAGSTGPYGSASSAEPTAAGQPYPSKRFKGGAVGWEPEWRTDSAIPVLTMYTGDSNLGLLDEASATKGKEGAVNMVNVHSIYTPTAIHSIRVTSYASGVQAEAVHLDREHPENSTRETFYMSQSSTRAH